jgi:hypothetical protein
MRSPDSLRSRIEIALRVVSVVAMAMLAVRLWTGAGGHPPEATATTESLDSALTTWSSTAPRSVTVQASRIPDATQRDWLVTIRRAGTELSWSAGDTTPGALVIEPGPLPDALARLTLLAGSERRIHVGDGIGRIDSVRVGRGGVASMRLRPFGALRASLGSATAVSTVRDSLVVKPVLLVGSAGWEAKFIAAALEEDGWTVSTRMQVAPGSVVRQGAPLAIDTGSYSAVMVIDSTSSLDTDRVRRFVNEGGGLVISGPGVRHPGLRSLVPRQVGQIAGGLGALLGPNPLLGLNTRSFVLRANSVVLDRRGGASIYSAMRVGSGRVATSGFDDTWRMRMVPPNEHAPRQHREFWSTMVGSVALVRPVPHAMPAVDEAPFAATVAALGPPIAPDDLASGSARFPWDALLAAIAAAALLAEWLSRRLRGVA